MNKRRDIEEIATRFVNLKNELAAQNFLKDYRKWFALGDAPNKLASEPALRIVDLRTGSDRPLKIWKQPSKEWQPQSERFANERAAIFDRTLLRRITQWSQQLRGAWGGNMNEAEDALAQILDIRRVQTPRQVKLGSAQIEPRDFLDRIAIAILKASERDLLRTCEGHKQGWQCPTPYLVADEKRRVYCYMNCGDEAKSQAKLKWWRSNLSANARKRKSKQRNRQ